MARFCLHTHRLPSANLGVTSAFATFSPRPCSREVTSTPNDLPMMGGQQIEPKASSKQDTARAIAGVQGAQTTDLSLNCMPSFLSPREV